MIFSYSVCSDVNKSIQRTKTAQQFKYMLPDKITVNSYFALQYNRNLNESYYIGVY